MTDMAISIRDLRKSYKQTEVLRGVNLDIQRGSIFCLLGSNGAGKTTMVKVLATLLRADSGTAKLAGFDVRREADQVRRVISLTGQYAAVDGLLTARENLRMIGRLSRVKEAAAKADELLAQFNLTHAADRPVSTFSGGMRRRLDIAMSLIGKPEVLFLDEPTTGLDPQSRMEMWKMIREMAGSGVTVFLTTQYIEEAEQLADHIAVLHEGRIIAQGNEQQLKSLLAGGVVLLGFADAAAYAEAQALLAEEAVTANEEAMTLSVTTDGSVRQLTALLNRLEPVEVASCQQQQATLEEVFLSLVTEPQQMEGSA